MVNESSVAAGDVIYTGEAVKGIFHYFFFFFKYQSMNQSTEVIASPVFCRPSAVFFIIFSLSHSI